MSLLNKQTNTQKNTRIAGRFLLRRIAAVLVFLLLVAGIVVTFTLFFHIKAIDVKGTLEIYTKQEIIDASGLQVNDSMFGFTSKSVENRITGTLPYVAKIEIKRTLPSMVTIQVTEADNALVLPYQTRGYLFLSRTLQIIRTSEQYSGKALEIYGISPVSISPGEILSDEEPLHIKNLLELLDQMEAHNILSGATALNVSDKLNLEIIYDNRIYAVLGTSSNMERKIRMLEEMVTNQLKKNDRGKLDLSVAGKATFSPLSEEEFESFRKKVCQIL